MLGVAADATNVHAPIHANLFRNIPWQILNLNQLENAMPISPTSTPAFSGSSIPMGPSKTAVTVTTGANEPEIPGVTYIVGGSYTYDIGRSPEDQAAFDYSVSVYHRQIPLLDSDDAIKTIDKQLASLDKVIAKQRPGIDKDSWDMTVEKGKLKVTGTLSKEDAAWLENKLNADYLLTAAVGTYMKSAVDYLETTDDNPPYLMQMSRVDGRPQMYDFSDVQKQLEGNIAFRDLSKQSWNSYRDGSKSGFGDPGNYRGGTTLEILASMLEVNTANPKNVAKP